MANEELEFHPVADIFPMMSEREFADLTADIAEHGLREPVWLHRDGRIIDGRNRYRACLRAGLPPGFREYQGDDASLVSFVVSLNLHRRHLNETQRGMVAARIANLGQGQRADRVEGSIDLSTAAEMLNVGEATAKRAKTVQDRGIAELVQRTDAGEIAASTAAEIARAPESEQRRVIALEDKDAILAAAKDIQRQRKDDRLREKAVKVAEFAARKPIPLVDLGPFPVIYADPPWRYDYAEDPGRQIENHYPTMSLDEIKALEVPAADDAVLFLWVTSPKLVEGLEVLGAWGFDYRTCMVWVKDRIGMGYYARQKHELLLIGKRGALPVPDPEDRPASVVEAPRLEHSAKPDLVYQIIETMYPLREKCELFQRRPRDGWIGWGNQAVEASA